MSCQPSVISRLRVSGLKDGIGYRAKGIHNTCNYKTNLKKSLCFSVPSCLCGSKKSHQISNGSLFQYF